MKQTLAVAVVAVCFFTVGAGAEESIPQKDVTTTVTAKTRHIYDSDVEAQPGEVGLNETALEVEFETKIAQKLPFTFSIGAQHVDIDSSIPTELPSHLDGWQIGLGTKFPAPFFDSEKMFMGLDIYPSEYTDSFENSANSAFRMPLRAYLIYKESDDFMLVGGVLVRPDYDTNLLPVLGFKWRPNEKILFNFVTNDPYISLKLCDKSEAIWEFDFVSDEYEVTRGTDRNVILKYSELSTGLGLRYKLTENIEATVAGGVVFARQLRYEDDQGKVEPDAGGYSHFKITVKF